MRVVEANNDVVCALEALNSADTFMAHAQQIIPYPISYHTSQALAELRLHVIHYGTDYQAVESIKQVRKRHE